MKIISEHTRKAWESGEFTGTRRAMTRVTVQKMDMTYTPYTLAGAEVLNDNVSERKGQFTSAMFGQLSAPVELPNLKSMRWTRSTDEPIATATFEFYNTEPQPVGTGLGALPRKQFDRPGFYTPNYAQTPYGYAHGDNLFASGPNGRNPNQWRLYLAPDRVIKSYEGYGYDPTKTPEKDPNLYPSGVWMIDTVTINHEGIITVEARDLGRLLSDHICYPPVVPFAEYPLYWDAYHHVKNPDIVETVTTGSDAWVRPTYNYDSNIAWYGNKSHHGHHGRDAFDGNPNSYFLSVGNSNPREPFAYEYVQGSIATGTVGAVSAHAYAGPYTVYISVFANGRWQGSNVIPYNQAGIGRNKTDIPFVMQSTIGANENKVFRLPQVIPGATLVRVTFGNLWNSGIGPYKYRGAVREVMAYVTTKKTVTTRKDGGTTIRGNYRDYTDIVKWYLAWAGFYWPNATKVPVPAQPGMFVRAALASQNYIKQTGGVKQYLDYAQGDPVLGKRGRIWGDLENTGTSNAIINVNGVNHTQGQLSAKLDIDVWDKQPILDCIKYVQDIVGFSFWIDEMGGAIFRTPNIWSLGNYIWNPLGGPRKGRAKGGNALTVLQDDKHIISHASGLSSRNVRERVFVGNIPGNIAAVSEGYSPVQAGLRRVGGWTDQRFASQAEAQRMADLITLRQMFTYRENRLTITANPSIQVDDQVKIREHISGEDYFHYVKGIESSWDVETGRWTYELTTHWLGSVPFSSWAFNPYDRRQLSPSTLQYLREALGVIP